MSRTPISAYFAAALVISSLTAVVDLALRRILPVHGVVLRGFVLIASLALTVCLIVLAVLGIFAGLNAAARSALPEPATGSKKAGVDWAHSNLKKEFLLAERITAKHMKKARSHLHARNRT